ncbi:nucleotide exchange factor GrpE [Buchnera aphidicola]|uniref:Protein GrpE n=1 Tax=Buchnera aphidicola (Aphis aurantii) TaxID=1470492 RepID=A0AAU6W722_9GAMM
MTNNTTNHDKNQEEIKNNSTINENSNLIKYLKNKIEKREEQIKQIILEQNKEIFKVKSRLNNEIEKCQKFSLEKLIIELLPIIDNIERACSLMKNRKDDQYLEILKNMENALSLFKTIFSEFSISTINDIKVEFNPNVHEAISIRYTNEIKSNQILEIMQSGYMMHNSRLLRPAMVIVSQKN